MKPILVEETNVPNFFDRQERISWWNQEKLSNSKVLIVGAGALGNEVIKNLSLLGVGHLLIVDFDYIEDSNLSRAVLFRSDDTREHSSKSQIAAKRAKSLNPNSKAITNYIDGNVVWEVGLGVYRHADLVVGCLDNIEARLSVNKHSWCTGKTWIDGGMWGLAGSVSVYDATFNKACYECGMTDDHYGALKIRYSCTNDLVKSKINQGYEPTTQTTSAVVGAIQTQEVIKILHGVPSFGGYRLMFNGEPHFYTVDNNPMYMIDLTTNSECCLCSKESKVENVVEILDASYLNTAKEIFAILQRGFEKESITINLGCWFVVSSTCPYCDQVKVIERPKYKVQDIDVLCETCEITCPTCKVKSVGVVDCPNCGQTNIYEPELLSFSSISDNDTLSSKYLNQTLRDLGVPALQILRINIGESNELLVELTGDIPKIWG